MVTYSPSLRDCAHPLITALLLSFILLRLHCHLFVRADLTSLCVCDGRVAKRCEESSKGDGSLQIMYGIHGEHELTEVTLDHLEGYKKSRPVRIGNGAYDQVTHHTHNTSAQDIVAA